MLACDAGDSGSIPDKHPCALVKFHCGRGVLDFVRSKGSHAAFLYIIYWAGSHEVWQRIVTPRTAGSTPAQPSRVG